MVNPEIDCKYNNPVEKREQEFNFKKKSYVFRIYMVLVISNNLQICFLWH